MRFHIFEVVTLIYLLDLGLLYLSSLHFPNSISSSVVIAPKISSKGKGKVVEIVRVRKQNSHYTMSNTKLFIDLVLNSIAWGVRPSRL